MKAIACGSGTALKENVCEPIGLVLKVSVAPSSVNVPLKLPFKMTFGAVKVKRRPEYVAPAASG